MRNIPEIKLYGTDRCHKTHYYQLILNEIGLPYLFLDVEKNVNHAEELRGLYENRKLNFPTITIGAKKLRNPYKEELYRWLCKLIPSMNKITHNKTGNKFSFIINDEETWIDYILKEGKIYLTHSEVPSHLRGKGIGKEMVLQTFEKLTKEGYKAIAICSYIKTIAKRSEKWNTIIE